MGESGTRRDGEGATGASGGKRTSASRQYVLLACGCLLALTLLATSYLQSSLGLKALDEVLGQSARLDRVDRLQMLMVDAETGVRGYLLSGEPVYLEPYEQAAALLPEAIAQIRRDMAGRPAEHDRVDALATLVNAKLQAMAEAVARRTMEGLQRDDQVGKILMDEARNQLADLRGLINEDIAHSIQVSTGGFRLTRAIGIMLALGSLALLLALFAVMRRQNLLRGRLAELLRTENARLEAQVAARTVELSQLARYLTMAREAEKESLARELHDELGSLLTAAKLDAGWMRRKLPPELREQWHDRIERLLQTLSSGIALKRRLIDDLRPPLLKDLGLIEALRALCEDFGMDREIRVSCELPQAADDIDEEHALAIFRIVQEAFTNVRRYARAASVGLKVERRGDQIRIEIRDDGVGFDPAHLAGDRHGLAGMRHRVQTYAGRFEIDSSPGRGTRILAELPLF